MKKLLFIIGVVLFLAVPSTVFAWTWETSYQGCDTWRYTASPPYDDISPNNCTDGADDLWRYSDYQCSSRGEEIVTAASRTADGTKGQRHWQGPGTNCQSGGTSLSLPSPSELWGRFYIRYEAGSSWSSLNYDKWLYFDPGTGGTHSVIPELKNSDQVNMYGDATGNLLSSTGFGWSSVFSDNQWHRVDFYIKWGSGGVGRMWIDGDLAVNATGINYGATSSILQIGNNQATPNHSGYKAQDWDDIKLTTDDPGDNGCEGGFSCIGAVGGAADTDPPTLSSATIGTSGTQATLVFVDESSPIVTTGYESGDFGIDCSVAGNDIALSSPSGSGLTWSFTIASTIYAGDTCNIDFTGTTGDITDSAASPNSMETCNSCATVTNNSTADNIAPTLTSATIGSDGATITFVFDDANSVTVGSGGSAGWTLSCTGGSAGITYSSGDPSLTFAYTIDRVIYESVEETCTISYTQPGDGIEDTSINDNDLANITDDSVTNNSTIEVPPTVAKSGSGVSFGN